MSKKVIIIVLVSILTATLLTGVAYSLSGNTNENPHIEKYDGPLCFTGD
jgi:Na+-transporting NADH:ubiquinone oxidoreductase subunit NqrC